MSRWFYLPNTRFGVVVTLRSAIKSFMTGFHVISGAKTAILKKNLIQLGLGVNLLGMEPLKAPCPAGSIFAKKRPFFRDFFLTDVSPRIFGVVTSFFHTNSGSI